ncbi:MAG: beta-N-acetylhexosaminidase, partial [Negativicutes bacterium]|nr:beta-N-acetylhexosaminidase [Negativicutes bacterium]
MALMNKGWRLWLAGLAVAAVATAVFLARPAGTEPYDGGDPVDDRIAGILADMTLADKVGQVVMCGFDGTDARGQDLTDLIDNYRVGNFVLFARNCRTAAQIADLTAGIQSRLKDASAVPALIAIDQEGGMVTRIFGDATVWPGAMALAASGDLQLGYRVANASGQELKAMGINMNLAPVADVNNNPDNPVIGVRSFGDDPRQVGQWVAAYVRGLGDAGVLATAKHFPGHGNTGTDSHLALPVITSNQDELLSAELVPFGGAIAAGVPAIMTAHIVVPALDPSRRPATLSPVIIGDWLRGRLGFAGLVVSDAMEMKAIADNYGDDAAVQALNAGVDLVCLANDQTRIRKAIASIRQAAQTGELPMSRLDQAAARVIKAKLQYNLLSWPDRPGVAAGLPDRAAHQALAERACLASLTLVADPGRLLPFAPTDRILAISTAGASLSNVEDSERESPAVAETLIQHWPGQAEIIDLDPDDAAIARLAAMASAFDKVVVATYNAHRHPGQLALVRELYAANPRLVAVAMRN